jgi:hypothetical protein
VNKAGPSTYEGVEGDGNGNVDGSEDTGVEGTGNEDTRVDGMSELSTSDHGMHSFEDVEVDDNDSEIGRSDIILSPPISDEGDGGISFNPRLEFHKVDLVNPNLKLKMKFSSLQLFREAVKQYNVKRGKDIQFVKNERARCVAIL